MAFDAIMMAAGFLASYYMRDAADNFSPLGALSSYMWICFFMVFLWISLYHMMGLYSLFRLKTPAQIISIVMRSGIMSFLVLTSILLLLKLDYVDHVLLLYFFIISR